MTKFGFAKLAAASVLSLCTAASALAGSVTQPGETVGLASGAPLPAGSLFRQYRGLGQPNRKSGRHVPRRRHSGHRLVDPVDDLRGPSAVPDSGPPGRGWRA